MYKLENNVNWTNELKNAFKHGITKAKIIYDDTEINYDNGLKDIEIQDSRYVPNLGFIGQATSRMATINLLNNNQSVNLENKELEIYIGADYNNETYYINYGKFIVDSAPENDETNGTIKIVAYDYMIKFNKEYDITGIVFPCTLKELLTNLCSQAEVELGTENFANQDFVVTDNQFEGKTLREVLQNIAKCAFSWARIGQDNKLYLDFANDQLDADIITEDAKFIVTEDDEKILTTEDSIEAIEILTINDYYQDNYKKANEYYGAINKVTYGDSNITGQEESVQDSADIAINGVKEIIINDNYFAYTTQKRQALIQEGTKLFGLKYMPIQQIKTIGLIYLDCNDIIKIEDVEGNYVITRCFSHIIKYNGATSDEFKTESNSDNQKKYENKKAASTQNSITEISVDRAEKKITSIVQQIGDRSQKTTTITQDIDGIESQVEDIEDLTNVVTGSKTVSINNAYPNNDILELHIYGNNGVFNYNLFIADDLYPSETLYPYGDSQLRFYNSKEDKTIELGVEEVLRANTETRDEVFINHEGKITLIRRINSDGTTKQNPVITELGTVHFTLVSGTNTFQIVNYTAEIEVKYAIRSSYTNVFATRVEMESSITQTAQEINLEVRKKVDNDEIISRINQSAEQIQIDAKKISLTGKSIDLTGDNIVITSTNFSVDRHGNIVANNGKFTGDLTLNYGNEILVKDSDGNKYMSMDAGGIGFFDDYSVLSNSISRTTDGVHDGISLKASYIGSYVSIGYRETSRIRYESDTDEIWLYKLPKINGTGTGKIFADAGGIEINNGLITDWNLTTTTGTVTVDGVTLTFKSGLLVGVT